MPNFTLKLSGNNVMVYTNSSLKHLKYVNTDTHTYAQTHIPEDKI